jgi:hypothetical protein
MPSAADSKAGRTALGHEASCHLRSVGCAVDGRGEIVAALTTVVGKARGCDM